MKLKELKSYLWNHFNKLMKSERGTWAGISVGINAASLGLSGAQAFGAFGGDENEDFNPEDLLVYKQLPDYPESAGARGSWFGKLQEWGEQPGYGAISPAWNEAWDLAKKKINQYYWGGVGDTGLAGKVKASAARRGASQSPALENQLAMLGMSEAGQISDLGKEEAINKAKFGESARQNWMTSLQHLAGLKPAYMTSTGVTGGGSTTYGTGEALSDIFSGAGDLASGLAKDRQMEDLLKKLLGGGSQGQYTPAGLASWFGKASPVTGQDPGFRVDPSLYQ
jgi:hypothetical protein